MVRLKYIMAALLMCLLLGAGRANAQWTVIDPSNICLLYTSDAADD